MLIGNERSVKPMGWEESEQEDRMNCVTNNETALWVLHVRRKF